MPATVIGIDPGLADTGYAVVRLTGGSRGVQLVEAGLVRTDPRAPLPERLAELHRGVAQLFAAYRPDAVAVEDLYASYRNPRTAILMGHARGVVLLAAAQQNAPVFHYPPARVKQALTGNGRAGKRQVQRMVQHIFDLQELPEPDHVADAMSLALCHHFAGRREGVG